MNPNLPGTVIAPGYLTTCYRCFVNCWRNPFLHMCPVMKRWDFSYWSGGKKKKKRIFNENKTLLPSWISFPLGERKCWIDSEGRHFYSKRDTFTYLLVPIIHIQLIVTAFVSRGWIITKWFIWKHSLKWTLILS